MSTYDQTLPKVAVLLTSFQGFTWIAEQISSIRSQKDVCVEIFVSDDGSTDGTWEWLKKNQKIYQLHLLPQGSTGSAARNFFRMLREVNFGDADFIALSDQDDIWLPRKLSRAIEVISNHKCDAYSGNVIAFWEDGTQKLIHKAQGQKVFDYMFESGGPGCSFVLSKNVALDLRSCLIEHEKALENVSLHDWFIYAFARSRGYRWHIDKVSHVLYRQHIKNVVGANVGVKANFTRLKTLNEGWLVKQALLIAGILGYSHLWPIQRLNRFKIVDRCYIALHCSKFRRRFRDQLAFAVAMFIT